MNDNILHILVLYQNANPELTEIQAVLVGAGIDTQLVHVNTWVNAQSKNNIEAFIIVLENLECVTHSIYTVLDLGVPVIILGIDSRYRLPDELQSHCDVLCWPGDRSLLLKRLHEIILQPLPTPLYTPKIKGLEQINSLAIHGVSDGFISIIDKIRKFSRSKAPVLIQGETGTGKELVARALHYLGPREHEAFIPINCSSLPDTLFENEVFGHARGAYTDAKEKYPGLVTQAARGTLFLDEIDSLQPRAQASLLRFLQDKKFRPLGSTQTIEGQCAIVAATNQNLEQLVNEDRFREDLLYRLNTVTITIPPLREHRQDIPLLARAYLRKLCEQYGQSPRSFHPETLKWLEEQHWPGNVRQLENCIHREFLLHERHIIHIHDTKHEAPTEDTPYVHIPAAITHCSFSEMRDKVVKDFERQYLHRLMLFTHGNVTRAARLANKERRCLGKLLKKYGIHREDYLVESQ